MTTVVAWVCILLGLLKPQEMHWPDLRTACCSGKSAARSSVAGSHRAAGRGERAGAESGRGCGCRPAGRHQGRNTQQVGPPASTVLACNFQQVPFNQLAFVEHMQGSDSALLALVPHTITNVEEGLKSVIWHAGRLRTSFQWHLSWAWHLGRPQRCP